MDEQTHALLADYPHDQRGVYSPAVSTLADRIRLILHETGWSQRRLSREAGLPSESHIALILTGRIGEGVTADTLARIARAAGVELGWLQDGTGAMHGAPSDAARWDAHPEWFAAVAEAERKFPGFVPPFAYTYAGRMTRAVPAAHVTPEIALQLARVWLDTASEDERAAATTAWARAQAVGLATTGATNDAAGAAPRPRVIRRR